MQHDFFVAARHREMSLGSHGNDREVDRAQHLLCHRADEQLAQLAPAPCPYQHSVRLKLAHRGCNLLCRIALANHCIACDIVPPRQLALWNQGFLGRFKHASSVVIGQPRRIG